MDVFTEMGIAQYGILLSEKDSITYPNALSPELRALTNPDSVHRVPDYTGATKEERQQRIEQIIKIAKQNRYNAIFAGYGFMAEDEEMVAAMEKAGLNFIGPCSQTVHSAGLKDEAKRTALKVGVSVTPGIDNASALTLLANHKDVAALKKLVAERGLGADVAKLDDASISLEDKADLVLAAGYEAGIDLYSVEELQQQIRNAVVEMYKQYPDNRIRLKAIGGGGGKGQRILPAPSSYQGSADDQLNKAADKAPELVLEILNEVKTTGVGDNKNVLVELNIETTRHQEIQVVGNGEWCITMGARDCSLQMHEQKLLEVSSTHESIANSIVTAEQALQSGDGAQATVDTLKSDLVTLDAMEAEATKFGAAVGLDSVSTFECIVDRGSHFFMEMNTRIQVEHRVTELCYSLKFSNPDNPEESFVVESLVELMVLLARHAKRLPKPERQIRKNSSVEARLNATNEALQPHAGGIVNFWSRPHVDEIRDDQGISMHNPDTDVFVKYRLAGAYDSNIALILTHGNDRLDSYETLSQIIRQTKLMGEDLCTNLEFHYGLVNWFIGTHIEARPTTKFIVPYLTAVGLLRQAAGDVDLAYAYRQIRQTAMQSFSEEGDKQAVATIIDRKQSLLLRPIAQLFDRPHALSGWLSLHKQDFAITQKDGEPRIEWQANPIQLLDDLYYYTNMEYHPVRAAQDVIWDHDSAILDAALDFYQHLDEKLAADNFAQLNDLLANDKAPKNSGFNAKQWQAVQASHQGYQAGMDILKVLPYLGAKTDFYALDVADDLSITLPEHLLDESLQKAMVKVLVPPLAAKSDEIIAASGGMFYPRETPGSDVYVKKGDHFEAGDTLYIVEVMKMFNKVVAPFSGTVEKVLVEDDGVIISKGQTLFKVKPDEEVVVEDPAVVTQRMREKTLKFLAVNCV
jgi:acetyl/propionyl-CoA carboxylase alpha subunit